jgi:electron transfer flavoprotein beta subunit
MKIIVGIKHVPDTETKIKVADDGISLIEDGVKYVMSPFDEYAVEEALALKEGVGEGEVILVCAGPESATTTLRQGLAMGADRAVLIQDDRFDRADGLVRAKALASIAKEESPDLILLGKQGVGTDESQTAPMLGHLLDLPHVSSVGTLEVGDGKFSAHRDIEGAVEIMEGSLPAVLGCDKGLNEPRYASLKGIMQAKKKTIDVRSASDAGIDDGALSADQMVVWEKLELPAGKNEGRILDGEPAEQARELVRILREEEKVI